MDRLTPIKTERASDSSYAVATAAKDIHKGTGGLITVNCALTIIHR